MRKDTLWGVLLFIGALLVFTSCENDYVTGTLQEGNDIVDPSLQGVRSLTIATEYSDSATMRKLRYIDGMEEFDRVKNPDTFIDNWLKQVQKFSLSWEKVENAAGYEIRVSHSPITESNWNHALAVTYNILGEHGATIYASIPLGKSEITPSKCTNCGQCVEDCPFGAISTINGKAVVDANICTSCGECYASCQYEALDGLFAGHPYYFAIRTLNKSGEVSFTVTCTQTPYELKYASVADINDTLKDPIAVGCGGNCGLATLEDGEYVYGSCYIASPRSNYFYPEGDPRQHKNVCPVGAIIVDSSSTSTNRTTAIFIDLDKCIDCGRCVKQCAYDNGHGAMVSKVRAAVQDLFGRKR